MFIIFNCCLILHQNMKTVKGVCQRVPKGTVLFDTLGKCVKKNRPLWHTLWHTPWYILRQIHHVYVGQDHDMVIGIQCLYFL